jgi:hypothetical protein
LNEEQAEQVIALLASIAESLRIVVDQLQDEVYEQVTEVGQRQEL